MHNLFIIILTLILSTVVMPAPPVYHTIPPPQFYHKRTISLRGIIRSVVSINSRPELVLVSISSHRSHLINIETGELLITYHHNAPPIACASFYPWLAIYLADNDLFLYRFSPQGALASELDGVSHLSGLYNNSGPFILTTRMADGYAIVRWDPLKKSPDDFCKLVNTRIKPHSVRYNAQTKMLLIEYIGSTGSSHLALYDTYENQLFFVRYVNGQTRLTDMILEREAIITSGEDGSIKIQSITTFKQDGPVSTYLDNPQIDNPVAKMISIPDIPYCFLIRKSGSPELWDYVHKVRVANSSQSFGSDIVALFSIEETKKIVVATNNQLIILSYAPRPSNNNTRTETTRQRPRSKTA